MGAFPSKSDERVIDRSGDIDQRPVEERPSIDARQPRGLARRESSFSRGMEEVSAPVDIQPPLPDEHGRRGEDIAGLCKALQQGIDKRHAKLLAQLAAFTQKIEAQEKRCVAPKLEDDLQQVRFHRHKLLLANGPTLADRLRQEKSCLADLEQFKRDNRLTRDAHYPESPLLAFAILLLLVLLEAGVNGVLFAETADEGLLGGWLEAASLATTNVGAAFLFGRLLLPQLNRCGFIARALAAAVVLLAAGCVVAINLAGAHYRDFKSALASQETSLPKAAPRKEASPSAPVPKAAPTAVKLSAASLAPVPAAANEAAAPSRSLLEREALERAVARPFALESFTSIFLLVIGLAGATIAAWDGYKFDDPFPGFGKRQRLYRKARSETATALRKVLGQAGALMAGQFQAIGRKVDAYAQEVQNLAALHHAYLADYREFSRQLDEAVGDAEAEIASCARLLRKFHNREDRETYAVSVKGLPELNEARVKAYDSHDRRLKALQKSLQKERGDVLGLFEEASADFQKLLSEAGHASLQASASTLPFLVGESE